MELFYITVIEKGTPVKDRASASDAILCAITANHREASRVRSGLSHGGSGVPDKVICKTLTTRTGFPDKILLTNGRISSEILSKALRCIMPLIATVEAPDS